MAIKRCSESFTIWRDGAPVAFQAGQLVDEKHPILKTHGHLFADPATVDSSGPFELKAKPVEEATAAPGEQRALTPPTAVATSTPAETTPFDPSEHNGPDVIAYLKAANAEERERVLAAEKDGKNRSTVLGADLTKE